MSAESFLGGSLQTKLDMCGVPVVRVGDEKKAATLEMVKWRLPIRGGMGETYSYERDSQNVFVPSEHSFADFITQRYDHTFYPRIFVTVDDYNRLNASGFSTMFEKRGNSYLMKINLCKLKALERSDFETHVLVYSHELQEKLSNLYFNESYPPTDAGRRLIAAFDEVQVQLLASIQANDRGCVDGIYWHELEHVAFAQQIEGILGDCDINRKSLYENIRDMNESRALFASIVRMKGSTSRAFLLFYNQNQLDGLRPIGDCPEMKKTVDAILDGAACTEQHMISYLIAMYGKEICNEDTRTLQLIDKEKLMKHVPVAASLGDMSSVILFDYTQRLLHDIANDPQLVVDRIVQIQKEILPIWANKLSFALQKTTLYSSTDSTPPQQST